MLEEIIEIKGKRTGPVSIVLAGVHGNEKCGVEVFQRILTDMQIENGRVLFGYGNPRAIKSNKRSIETNLNRIFKNNNLLSSNEKMSYEYERAQFLKTYFAQADALLDVHASLTPNSKPFIICEANAKGIVKYLPIGLVVSGFDQVEPGGTDYYMNSIGKIGICAECGYLGDSSSKYAAEKSIFAFLKARGHIKNNLKPRKQSYVRIYTLYKTMTNKFTLVKSFNDFEEVSEGQVIGIDGEKEVRTEKSGVILFARNREKIGAEAFLFGEKKAALRKIMQG